ncbi:hypothetical protein CRQ31_05555 [Salmonella enterica subsp. enterica serovar Worthington]|uniref:Outer membrane lipoprotein-sorting protein n=1 Tax=Salmonella enterica subsp. enterica serovar Ank TaxID=1173578 RepID=A0A5I2XDG5_SALET|nr:hypothetical protein [Salmonella enterica]EBS1326916.1 hypothetical protein [Salmonella enterica subsp. enterica serovar Muenchen]ECF3885269.1 hypothetical protein [Salmonella enterica subsp. enterica serovar Ank]EGI5051715.1 hypothetical protein [Salmonella enterica subsp. enterica serovar Worthington]QGR31509.1 hypothetical protein FOC16_00820 [Salmonella enterica]HAE1791669.1 hypothetical protein [Salmonella enterica subsp. enterica serovar Ank]
MKKLILFIISMSVVSISQAETPMRNDPLNVSGFNFAESNKAYLSKKIKDIYGSCYRLEEPLVIRLSAEGNGVAGAKSWRAKVRFTLPQSKIIDSVHMSARDENAGVTWIDNRAMGGNSLYALGNMITWDNAKLAQDGPRISQRGWQIETDSVNNNKVMRFVTIPTRNLETLEFIFESDANPNNVHIMFRRIPGTNFMNNVSLWYPKGGDSANLLDTYLDPKGKGNKLRGSYVDGNPVKGVPYGKFSLVRAEQINFAGVQRVGPSQIWMGVYEADFRVDERERRKYGITAEQFDAACQ